MKKLGKYEVLGELGHGAMGVVYRARDPFINRLVALKTITTGVADDPALLQRFYREAQSAGGLQHPNIVTIYDMGEADELPYIAMELVEGENLEQVIASRSALPIPLKLVYAMQACRAFDYAHKRGIVHRDIKPGNVMLSKDGTVKVVDFGIARVLENSRTQTGLLIGTFAYMSPEQYHGEHADERSDIWSFGVLVYELLCYQKPFTGPTPASLMHSICEEDPVPLTKILPECPDELATVVSKMLRKSPAERYQSMEDVLLDLDPVCRTLQSQSVAELLEQTRQFFDQRRFAEGRDLVRQALQLESGNPQGRSMLEKANIELKRISNRPKVQQFVEKGQALLLLGKVQEAKVAAESALQLDSSYVPAEDLQRAIQKELDRARVLAEWLEAAKQKLAEGLTDEVESLLAKVLEAEPSNPEAQDLQQQVLKEKAEREKSRRLLKGLQQARELWTRQNYAECLMHLEDLAQQFPAEEQVSRLLESVREDQIEQQRQQALLQSRNLFAAGRHDSAITLLADLQKQFPSDEGISGLLEDVRRDQMNQRRLLGLAEARSLLAAGQYDPCISLLTSLNESFPHDQEIPKLLEAVHQNKAEQLRQRGVAESRKLLAARRYEECVAFLTNLEKQFPGDEEILALEQTIREERTEQQKQQGLEDARNLLTARHYAECLALLASLEDRFPADTEILRLQSAVTEDQAKQRRLQGLEQVRSLLGSKNYEKAAALLAFLQQEFPEDDETQKLLESTQKEQADQRRREGLAQARDLLASQRYEDSITLLIQLQTEFVGDTSVSQLLESARKEKAKHRQSEGVAQARSLLAARQYDESISLLSKLQADFPEETEIARLLATAQEDLAEHQKHQRLADARSLLAAQSFSEALAILDGLATAHPKDSAVTKLRTLVQREQSQHAKAQKLQQKLDALKKMMGDKRYPEVISQAKELLTEFPADANLVRLTEFATSRQADIERELLLKKKFEEAKGFFDAGRFDDAARLIKTTLRTFPGNAELQSLYQQCEAQQKKLQVRQQIEQRIREVKVKINRDELSEAVDLAQQTLVTLGPDTDLTHLLNSAQVELESREKKRLQEQTLQSIRSLIESGDFDGASRTIDEVLEAQTVGSFDPRIQRLTEQIKEAKTPAAGQPAPSPSPVTPGLSREYAFLQATPLPEAPPPLEKVPPPNSTTGTTQFSASTTALPQRVSADKTAEFVPSTPETVMPSSPQTSNPESKTEIPAQYSPVVKIDIPQSPPLGGSPIEVEATPAPRPLSVPLWRKPAILVISALALSFALWIGVRSLNVKLQPAGPPEVKVVQQPSQPHFDPVEAQQRKDLDSANSKIAENDLDGAVQLLQQAEALSGPLTSEIQNRLAQVEESKKDANLRQLRQHEAELWQQATRFVADGRYTEAQKDLKQILALPAGGVRKDDAHHYLDKTIPQQKMQNSLSAQARQSLAQGDFQSARRAAEQLKQNGSNPAELVADIDQAEQSQLKQMESLFDQLKERDDDSSIQQLRALQPKFQALAGDGGPQSSDALNYANNIPGAIADIRARMDKKSEDAAFEQVVQRYRQAAATNDKNGLATARGDFQSIVQNGGAHYNRAQQYVDEINKKLDTLNAPPPPPPLPQTTIKEAPDTRAADDAAVRSVVQSFFQAFQQRNPDALRQVWPSVPQQRYDRYKGSFEHVSAITIQILSEGVKMSSDGTSATVSVQSLEEETPKGEKKARIFKPLWTFQLIKKDGTWRITDVL